MTDGPLALIPHTLRDRAATTLSSELADLAPSLEVRVATTPTETYDGLAEASILLAMGFEDEWYDHLDTVEWIQALFSGIDHLDLERFENEGVTLTNAAGVHAEPISQQVLGYMLAFERNLHRAIRQQVTGVWERFSAGELGGKTLGIVGVGAIGTAIARVCSPYDMEVIGVKRDTSVDIEHIDRLLSPDRLDEVLASADYLVLACPLTEETNGLIDASALRVMGSDSVLINIARGAVIDETALAEALQQRWIRGAALDVFEEEPLPSESPLWGLSNVIITPHMAGSTPHYWRRCAELVATNYELLQAGALDEFENRVV